jgi:hypothetical protein
VQRFSKHFCSVVITARETPATSAVDKTPKPAIVFAMGQRISFSPSGQPLLTDRSPKGTSVLDRSARYGDSPDDLVSIEDGAGGSGGAEPEGSRFLDLIEDAAQELGDASGALSRRVDELSTVFNNWEGSLETALHKTDFTELSDALEQMPVSDQRLYHAIRQKADAPGLYDLIQTLGFFVRALRSMDEFCAVINRPQSPNGDIQRHSTELFGALHKGLSALSRWADPMAHLLEPVAGTLTCLASTCAVVDGSSGTDDLPVAIENIALQIDGDLEQLRRVGEEWRSVVETLNTETRDIWRLLEDSPEFQRKRLMMRAIAAVLRDVRLAVSGQLEARPPPPLPLPPDPLAVPEAPKEDVPWAVFRDLAAHAREASARVPGDLSRQIARDVSDQTNKNNSQRNQNAKWREDLRRGRERLKAKMDAKFERSVAQHHSDVAALVAAYEAQFSKQR